MRCFVALELPSLFVEDVAGVCRALSEHVEGRFLPRSSFHVTLAFLGEICESDSSKAVDAIEAACEILEPVPLVSDGLGKFGRNKDATLWLGLSPEPELMQLAQAVREELSARGVDYDGKPFKPHITLARHAKIPDDELPSIPFPADDTATVVKLVRSSPGPKGSLYKTLHSVELTL